MNSANPSIARTNRIRYTPGERAFIICNGLFMFLICAITIYPFLNTLALSFNDGNDALRGGIYIWPRVFSLKNYQTVFKDNTILRAYSITILRTVIGTASTLLCTGILAYGVSKKHLMGRRIYIFICMVAMIFNPGLIPTYILYMNVGLLNNFWVYILPAAVNVYFMILMKTYFEQLPLELEESGMIDGAGQLRIFAQIIVPIAMPVIATVCIFAAVDQWNAWFDAYMFVPRKMEIHPVQTYLYQVIALSQRASENAAEAQLLERLKTNITTIRATTVIITTVPIVFIYVLFQKHFIKGVMVGALKG